MVLPVLAAQGADLAYQTAMGGLTAAINGLKDKFDKAMEIADNAQRTSLSLGKTYDEVRKELKSTFAGLRGSIENKLQVGFLLLNSGLEKNSGGIARLINQQQLTGTSFSATAKSLAKLESSLGISRDSNNKLADSLILLTSKYGVSTDKLIDSILSLKETFGTQKALGLGVNFQEAIAILVSRFGPAFAEDISNAVKYILEPGILRTSQLQMLGLASIRQFLEGAAKTASPETIAETLEIVFRAIAKKFNQVGQGDFETLGIYEQLLGPVKSFLPFLNAQIRDPKIIQAEKALSEFADSIDTFRKEAWAPFTELIMDKTYNAFKDLNEIYYASINVFFRAYSDYIDVISQGKDVAESEVFKKLKGALIDASESISLFGAKVLVFLTEGGLDLLKSAINLMIVGLEKTFKPGGYFDEFQVGFMEIITDIKDSLDFGFRDPEVAEAIRQQELREANLAFLQGKAPTLSQFQEALAVYNTIDSEVMDPQTEYGLRGVLANFEKEFPSFYDAIETGYTDAITEILSQVAGGSSLSKQYEDLQAKMDTNVMITQLKEYFAKLRDNDKKNISLLTEIETNTNKTAKATQEAVNPTAPIPAALVPVSNSIAQNAMTALSTAGVEDSYLNDLKTSVDELTNTLKDNIEEFKRNRNQGKGTGRKGN